MSRVLLCGDGVYCFRPGKRRLTERRLEIVSGRVAEPPIGDREVAHGVELRTQASSSLRVPIERGMEIIAKQGLPVRKQLPQKEGPGERTTSAGGQNR